MRAREYFEAARDAAKALSSWHEWRARAESAAELKVQRYTDGGGTGDWEPPAFAMVAAEADAAELVGEWTERVESASNVLYGADGRGGLCAAYGSLYADAVTRTYLMIETDAEAAEALGVQSQRIGRLCALAFIKVDELGLICSR